MDDWSTRIEAEFRLLSLLVKKERTEAEEQEAKALRRKLVDAGVLSRR